MRHDHGQGRGLTMKTITITKTLYTYDELSPEAKARALEEYAASPSGAEADYESLVSDVNDTVAAFEDAAGIDIRIGGGVYSTTYKSNFSDDACYDDVFPDFSRDSVWCDIDIASAWINDDEFIDVRKEFAHCAYMRDRFSDESDTFLACTPTPTQALLKPLPTLDYPGKLTKGPHTTATRWRKFFLALHLACVTQWIY